MTRLAEVIGTGFVLALVFAGCGDSGGPTTTESPTTTTPTASATTENATTDSTGSTVGPGSETEATGSGSTGSSGSSTGGPPLDPNYPPPDEGGGCGEVAAPVQVPGGIFCGVFCQGEGGTCPAPANGDAVPECAPFLNGGSMDACDSDAMCSDGEVCYQSQCVVVAFWACNLTCEGGETCPEGMECITGLCAYPL